MNRIRIVIVDDHALVRMGLTTLICDRPDMQVVGEASNLTQALRVIEETQPQIVLMDIRMPGESGIEATRQIVQRFPQTRVIILTSYSDDELVMRAIHAGASGYVLKQADNDVLLDAIQTVARGESLLDPATTTRLLHFVREMERKAEQNAFRDLSERELSVLAELAKGKTNAEIGRTLHLSEKTVRNHVSVILEKLHLSNRVELATYAVEHHIFDLVKRD
ncbi:MULTISPECIES: response regulator transcription factor [Anaerolinea]|uniref:NarL family two-component response regulator n=1 Tax=Anaerolinea thermophila (strain DSM 14523 / JCM 11388 / NBRC 100420 / UNI-1) TaxID=926569 RepID=E8N2A1_ANATU|nr:MULTISPECIES: response regulator transcription factor [Anaerolinea]BAJ65048.1 NarL family two-component response regulator [Anaerolinea thermophila UNI-1]